MNTYIRLLGAWVFCILVNTSLVGAEKRKDKNKCPSPTTSVATLPAAAPAATLVSTPTELTQTPVEPTLALPALVPPATPATTSSSALPSIEATPAPLTRFSAFLTKEKESTPAALVPPATTAAPASPALTSTIAPALSSTTPDFNSVPDLPFSTVADITRHPEQIQGLTLFGRIKDAADYQAFSHENYLKKHVDGQTLAVALPTADSQRAKFGHAANELVQKAADRKEKNIIVRMSKLVKWAEAHKIELNQADLGIMKQQAIVQIKDALATLALLNSKITITGTSPFDLVGKKSTNGMRRLSGTQHTEEQKS
ncbi:MAG: hypothetical protein ACHQVS_02280 [Candidatus Babeliales bacterium]